jgi:hypothetical protein
MLFLYCIVFTCQAHLFAQNKGGITTVCARVIDIDSIDLISFDNTFLGGFKYFYGICHFKVVTPKNDLLVIGMVYSLINEGRKLSDKFGIERDSLYIFYVSEFTPCYSDFPRFCNCDFKNEKKYGQIIPSTGSVISQPYSKINRIIYFAPLDKNLWKQLAEW